MSETKQPLLNPTSRKMRSYTSCTDWAANGPHLEKSKKLALPKCHTSLNVFYCVAESLSLSHGSMKGMLQNCFIWAVVVIDVLSHLFIDSHSGDFFTKIPWLALISLTLDLIALVSSLNLGRDLLASGQIEEQIARAYSETTRHEEVMAEIKKCLRYSVVCVFVVGLLGASAEVTIMISLWKYADVEYQLSQGVFIIGMVANTFTNLCTVAGLVVFGVIVILHRIKARSCYRLLSPLRPEPPTLEHAIDRVYEVDFSLGRFGHKQTFYPPVIGAAFALKFFFLVMFRLTSPSTTDSVHLSHGFAVYTMSYAGLVSGIIYPSLVLLVFLLPVAMLNQSVGYLRKVTSRYIIKNRNIKGGKDSLKKLNDYIKNGDFVLRISGFEITASTAWQFFVLASTTFFTVIRLQEVDLLG